MFSRLIPVIAAVLLLPTAIVGAATLEPLGRLSADGQFSGGKPRKAAVDVSGLACMPVSNGIRRCLLINDEGSFAQFAHIAENRVTAGATLPIIGDAAAPDTLGSAPSGICGKPGRFTELDGEAVTYADGAFYVAGSHGCSRRRGEFRLSAFHLARIKVDDTGAPADRVELTYRLGDALRRAGAAGDYFGKALADANGLNVEGLAVSGSTLWAGLRAPTLDDRSFLVGVPLVALFASGHAPLTEAPQVLTLPSGAGRGIRDLAALPDGRLLALIGPAQEQAVPYALMLADPRGPGAAMVLGDLPERGRLKAEALTVLAHEHGRLDLLVGYDGARNGGFERYLIPLQQEAAP